jgi:predicted transcriptional regulator
MSPSDRADLPALHERESDVMEQIWDAAGETTVRAVMEALNRRDGQDRAYTTFMTIMSRLADKGFLARRREGKTDLYQPTVSRAEYLERRAAREVEALVDQYGDAAFVHFARQMNTLDPKRREQLRRLARRG